MARIEKTVFISYRRTDFPWALAIHKHLTHEGFDVFFDYLGIASGDFERVILDNIRARAHFVVVLTPSALDRCVNSQDWLRREVEESIESQRNIVPLFIKDLTSVLRQWPPSSLGSWLFSHATTDLVCRLSILKRRWTGYAGNS